MSKKTDVSRRNFFKVAGGAGAVAALLGATNVAKAQNNEGFELDVCCDGNTFVFTGPTHEDGSPAYGATFVVEGFIYPNGTLEEQGAAGGINADGSPELPSSVIGKWTCYGTFVGDGVRTEEGRPDVVTTQIYDFDVENPGNDILMSQGYELAGLNYPFKRNLQGGTGFNSLLRGIVTQEAVGMNATGVANIHFKF
jgi:hypothetical protein